MSEDAFYTSPEWLAVRDLVLERDANHCILRRFVGGRCSGPLHVHHIEPRSERPDLGLDPENLVTCCAGHHPSVEAFRRFVARLRSPSLVPLRCNHKHPYRQGRIDCYRRRLRAAGIVADESDLAAVA
jgi:hypothetical protein